MKTTTVYKVCWDAAVKYESAVAGCGTVFNQLRLRYAVGKVTKPKVKGSKLFAFKTREDAQRYCAAFWRSPLVILECQATEVKTAHLLAYEPPTVSRPRYDWVRQATIDAQNASLGDPHWPNTVVCDTIKPLVVLTNEPGQD